MKKLSYICLAFATALGMVACSDDYTDWAKQSSSAAPEAATVDGFTATATGTVDLNRPGSNVVLCVLTNSNGLSEGYSVQSINLELTPASADTISSDVQTLELDPNGIIDSATVQSAVTHSYGLSPTARPFTGKVTAVVSNGDDNVLVNAGTINVYITPAYLAAPLYWIVGLNGWDTDGAQKSVLYPSKDNPSTQFSYTAQWPNQWSLKIWATDNIGDWDNAWCTQNNGDNSASGSLVQGNLGAFGPPTENEYYTLNIDMNAKTYSWTKIDAPETTYDHISLIGGFNGWGGDLDLEHASDGNVHNWYAHNVQLTAGGFKFRANHGWDIAWGTNESEGSYVGISGSLTVYGRGLIGGSNGNLTLDSDGTYDVYFNDITGQYVFVPVI